MSQDAQKDKSRTPHIQVSGNKRDDHEAGTDTDDHMDEGIVDRVGTEVFYRLVIQLFEFSDHKKSPYKFIITSIVDNCSSNVKLKSEAGAIVSG